MKNKSAVIAISLLIFFSLVSFGFQEISLESKDRKNQSSKNDTSNLLNRIRVLEEDNERLRKMVIALERKLKSLESIPSVNKSKESSLKKETALTHWITTSSGIRHNSSCRYFRNSKGTMCLVSAGRACKKCGG